MSEQLRLIGRRLEHLRRMRGYLEYSAARTAGILPKLRQTPDALTQEEHETLAAFRVRFSEFQEHLGKTLRNVAIEEEVDVERFGSVLAYMEKIGVLDSTRRWKEIRELRNSANHEYEDNAARLAQFFAALLDNLPILLDWHRRLAAFVVETLELPASTTPEMPP